MRLIHWFYKFISSIIDVIMIRIIVIEFRYSLMVLVMLLSLTTKSQDIYKINYTIDDGLPSNQVYDIIQDKEGIIWIGTDRGMCSFDGYDFKSYSIEDGLPDKLIFNLYCDYQNRIWVGTGVPRIAYIKEDKIIPYKYNHILDSANLRNSTSYSIYVDEDDNVFYGDKYNGIIIIDSLGNMQRIQYPGASYLVYDGQVIGGMTNTTTNFRQINKSRVSTQLVQNFFSFEKGHLHYDTTLFLEFKDRRVLNEGPIGKYIHKNLMYFIQGNCLTKRENGEYSTRIFKNRIDAINNVSHDELWLGMCESGIEVFGTIVSGSPVMTMHENNYISQILKDMNSGYWYTTINEGVYFYPSLEAHFLINSSLPKLRVVDIETDEKGGAYVMYNNKDVWYVDQKMNAYRILKSKDRLVKNKSHIYYDLDIKALIVGQESMHYEIVDEKHNFKFVQIKRHKRGAHVTAISKIGKDKYIFGRRGVGLAVLNEQGDIKLSNIEQLDGQTLKIQKYKDGWLFANDIGLFSYDGQELKRVNVDKVLRNQITDIAMTSDEVYFLAIPGRGLGVLEKDSFQLITIEHGLIDNSVFAIERENDSIFWIGTATGMNRFHWNQKKHKIWSISKFGNKDGLPSEFITHIEIKDNNIWVGTVNGLICADKNKLLDYHMKPHLKIDDVMVNNSSVENIDGMILKHNQNFIKFKSTGVSFESNKKITYSYRLTSIHDDWRTTGNRVVEYNNILPGEHTFEIKAKNEHDLWSAPRKLTFTISPPFYQTAWFIVLEILSLIGIVTGIFKWRERRMLEKDKINTLERNRLEMELNALRAQMNPHFTFNVLNSIQQYIMSNDKSTAQKYLTAYAQMVRNILNYSREGFISLSQEIDFLKSYIDLELMRFPKKIEYEIIVNEDLEIDLINVPALLIQPYVENAINHGLLNSKKQGKLVINLKEDDEVLKCTIEDNGIGREAARKIREETKRNHVSAGLSINQRRLELLNADTSTDVSVKIIDLKDNAGHPLGTRVELNISLYSDLA